MRVFVTVLESSTLQLDSIFPSVCSLSYILVFVKVYPGQRTGGVEADMMAANELNAHSFLQVGYIAM